MSQTADPVNILLLCENEEASRLDRRALREAGYSVTRVMTSGIEAARLLAGLDTQDEERPFWIVVCSRKLADMDSEQFCGIVRSHPLLLSLPILLLLPNADEACQLEALGCGASALLSRPYTVDALRKQLNVLEKAALPLRSLENAARKIDTSAFDSALASYGLLLRPERQPDDYFRVGMKFLQENRWNYAISAFQKALADAHIKAEAELGMAAAFKGKGDQARFRGWLERAANTLVHAKRWHLARTAYARLLQHDPDARNPFLAEAHKLIRSQEYDEAADALAQSLSVIPRGATGDRLAKLCMIADDPEEMRKALEEGLARNNTIGLEFLSQDISRNLENMVKEKEERQRQLAAERKWEIKRRQSIEKAAQETEKQDHVPLRNPQQSISPLEMDDMDPLEAYDELPTPDDEAEINESDQTNTLRLEPLTRSDATSGSFVEKPRFNEFLSVVKLTWKLAKRSRKKSEK